MAHISPQLPADGQQNWAGTADAYLTTLLSAINTHDDEITALQAGGGTSGQGTGDVIVDNGDGTITILPGGSSGGTPGGTGTASIAFDTDGVPYVAI